MDWGKIDLNRLLGKAPLLDEVTSELPLQATAGRLVHLHLSYRHNPAVSQVFQQQPPASLGFPEPLTLLQLITKLLDLFLVQGADSEPALLKPSIELAEQMDLVLPRVSLVNPCSNS